MRWMWLCTALVGCGSESPPSGTYTLNQTPTTTCSFPLPATAMLVISKHGIASIYGVDAVPTRLEAPSGSAPNLVFGVAWDEYIGIVDSTPTTVHVTATYALHGSDQLDGTATSTAAGNACSHTVVSID